MTHCARLAAPAFSRVPPACTEESTDAIIDRGKEAFDFRPQDVVGRQPGKIERCEAITLSLGRKLQPISADGRFFNMKMTMFALVLAIGMAFSAFAADEPQKIELEGVIQQLPAGRLFGIWMVSQRAVSSRKLP
jgi:hypothetical protein